LENSLLRLSLLPIQREKERERKRERERERERVFPSLCDARCAFTFCRFLDLSEL
jgi:hypothetical protein